MGQSDSQRPLCKDSVFMKESFVAEIWFKFIENKILSSLTVE